MLFENGDRLIFAGDSVTDMGHEGAGEGLFEAVGRGYVRVIENLLELVPECPRMLSDKFGNESLIRRALMERGRQIEMQQQVRAESDVAVAAASILARDQFVRVMDQLSENCGIALPKGAGPQVKITARKILEEKGADALASCVKMHFKTWNEITGSPTTDAPSLFE